ncbi:acetylornithine deacetylase [Phenylobacterium sp.]|jgi:acetylornithine deacetylase|uniref:acetylornithine deacetylase n=1 Tax=Phenylobacterium sp. TaxID=1871053 RepID=UPI002F428524
MTDLATTRGILETLIGFDTTSRNSNLALVEWVEAYLDRHGAAHRRVANADGTKSNLLATIGPNVEGGAVLSGHTDVVPVDGQPWSSDPWTVVEKDGRLYGRGTCDMKGFLALALAAVPDVIAARPQRPVHLAFSYDEEIGCLGAPAMIEVIGRELPKPAFVVVGEPTDMQAVGGHKGIATFHVTVTGREAHSSQTQQGVSAVSAAVKLMAYLVDLAERLERDADPASPFTPKGATLTIGMVNGGTAHNILARECTFVFDLRVPPPLEPHKVLAGFFDLAKAADAALKARAPEAGVAWHMHSNVPGFAPEPGGAAEAFARRLAGDNGPPRVVSFATEAGQFQRGGLSTILCGPGSILQAHQPDEYVEISQMERGVDFMRRLTEWAAS